MSKEKGIWAPVTSSIREKNLGVEALLPELAPLYMKPRYLAVFYQDGSRPNYNFVQLISSNR